VISLFSYQKYNPARAGRQGRFVLFTQVIVKFLDKYMGGELASVVGEIQVTWYPSGQWATEGLDPT